MQRWMGGKRRKAVVQRRDPLAQQRQFFARNREHAIHASEPKNVQKSISNPRRSRPKKDASRSKMQPPQGRDISLPNVPKGRKRNRNPPKMSSDLLALAHLDSNDVFQGALQQPRKKRHKSLKRPPLPPGNGKVNRTLAVNAESNSIRVFEGDVEKTMIYRPPSIGQSIANRWQVDPLTPSKNPEKATHRGVHQTESMEYRRRSDPRIAQKNAEDFSCFSRAHANALDNGQAMRGSHSHRRREQRNSDKTNPSSSPKNRREENRIDGTSNTLAPAHQVGKLPPTQSPYWDTEVAIGDETQSRQPSPKHLSPLGETPGHPWNSQSENRHETTSREPSPMHSSPDARWADEYETGDELYSRPPSPMHTKIHLNSVWYKQDPMNLDDFSAEITAIEEKILFSVDNSAGKFKRFYARKPGSLSKPEKPPASKGTVRVASVLRKEAKENDLRQHHPSNPNAVNALPRQTFCEGVESVSKINEVREDSVVIATFSGTSPIAAASEHENKISLLTVRPSSPDPKKKKSTSDADADQ